jgi:hypothetical protein
VATLVEKLATPPSGPVAPPPPSSALLRPPPPPPCHARSYHRSTRLPLLILFVAFRHFFLPLGGRRVPRSSCTCLGLQQSNFANITTMGRVIVVERPLLALPPPRRRAVTAVVIASSLGGLCFMNGGGGTKRKKKNENERKNEKKNTKRGEREERREVEEDKVKRGKKNEKKKEMPPHPTPHSRHATLSRISFFPLYFCSRAPNAGCSIFRAVGPPPPALPRRPSRDAEAPKREPIRRRGSALPAN